MPANNTSLHVGYLAGRFPNRVGHLYSLGDQRGPWPFIPFALDNGRFPCWSAGKEWDEAAFMTLLERYAGKGARWAIVPDVVGDRDATLRSWDEWAPRVESYGYCLAMAVQDGMTPADVPEGAVCFIGGTTAWKRQNIWKFCRALPRVHVGRINTEKWLWACHKSGAESCDGTGFYRSPERAAELTRYLKLSTERGSPLQAEFEFSQRFCKPVARHRNRQHALPEVALRGVRVETSDEGE